MKYNFLRQEVFKPKDLELQAVRGSTGGSEARPMARNFSTVADRMIDVWLFHTRQAGAKYSDAEIR